MAAVEALQSDYETRERELSVYQKQADIERHSTEVHARITDPDDMVEEEEPAIEPEVVKMQTKTYSAEPQNVYRKVSRAQGD